MKKYTLPINTLHIDIENGYMVVPQEVYLI